MLDHSAEHLIGVIDDILDFSRIEAGELKVESIPFTPAVAINDVVQLFVHRAKKNDIELKTTIAPELSGQFMSDPGRIRQILQNLIGNALKFTHSGSVTVQARMKIDPDGQGQKLHLSIADTGIGIPPEICERLFEPFVQADASTARLYGGSGLGLSICHRLTDLMGGSIGVTSQPGSGSTFTVVLPLAAADATARAASTDDTQPGGAVDEADVPGLILVVEDNPVNQAVVEMQLERLGHEVVVANGGQAGLDELATGKPYDVVLMDCQMPGMDGFTATGHIREIDGTMSTIPVVAMTANALREDREACLAAGMNDYLAKPVRADDLKLMLDRWIAKSRAARGVQTSAPAPPPAADPAIPVVDVNVLNQLVEDLGGDKSVLGEFTGIFLRELPKRLEAIQLQLPADDRHAMRERAHALRSPSRALGLARLDDVCERMERAALNGSLDEARSLERALLMAAEASVAELCQLAPAAS
jgi:CheY-like chemotaxis protein